MLKCPRCKNDIELGARFCSTCGYNLVETVILDGSSDENSKLIQMLQLGASLGNRFTLIESLATGGMGHVFKAKDTVLDEIVALKILKADLALEKENISRFKREIKVARKVKHPNVCTIYDFGSVDEIFFISMEFIKGKDLSDLFETDEIPLDKKLVIVKGILSALNAAHRENIIHRDLKPSNIKITEHWQPIILDFGIARYVGNPDLTAQEEILGTPTYMSPEQFKGDEIDQRTDIYSLGVIMYHLYTGVLPFTGSTPIEIAMSHLEDPVKPPRDINKDIPPKIEKVIIKCLEKDRNKRYQNVEQIQKDLEDSSSVKKQSSQTTKKKTQTILIADDDEDIRKLLTTIFSKNGYNTIQAINGEEAIQFAIEHKPDLICMDLMMPGMDGYEAAEFLRDNAMTSTIPIVMITCKQDKEYRAYGKSIGVKQYITKPFDIYVLLKHIKQILPS